MIASSGNKGDGARSDCFVEISVQPEGGIHVRLQSKVESMYGNSIRELCLDILDFFGVKNAKVEITDSGALPFVIAARLESAIHQVTDTEKVYLPPVVSKNKRTTGRDIRRRSRLYIPGDNPKLMLNAGIYNSDGIILDLEDAVAPDKKDDARYLVRNALRSVNFYGSEVMVRINQLPFGLKDLEFVVPHGVQLILVPKCETREQVKAVDHKIAQILGEENTKIHLMPIIESALGAVNAYEIATSSPNVVAMAIGLEDYTADLGVQRTHEGTESFYARSALVNAAKAAGIQAIDSVFSDVDDLEALAETVKRSKAMGFAGMGCIHPRQVAVINENFNPGPAEIEKALKIVDAFDKAREKGLGVVALGSKMIDAPVVKRALSTINDAMEAGLIDKNRKVSIHENKLD